MTERQDIILGAGLAGLTAAYTLQERGESHWQVYEKEDRVGGHARSLTVDGFLFDFGPHILFTRDSEMEDLIRHLLAGNFRAQHRQAFIYHARHKTYTRFPFQAHLHGLPVSLVTRCLADLVTALEDRARGEHAPENYEQWMRGTFGTAIAETLMIPYARKIWTVEPDTMDFSWIDRRVPTPDVARIVLGALTDDVADIGATATFWYPQHGGIEALPRALGERVDNVQFGQAMERLDPGRKLLSLRDGTQLHYDSLIFTLPLNTLSQYVAELPPKVEKASAALQYQGVYCVNLGIARPNLSEKHWLYFYEDMFPFHRISFPANFSPDNVPPGMSSIAAEVAFPPHRPLERDAVLEQTISALTAADILSPDDRIEVVHTQAILPAYVIYDLDHVRNVDLVRSWLAEHDIWTAGRFGDWEYSNMDESMRSGKRIADSIADGRRSRPAALGATNTPARPSTRGRPYQARRAT